MDKTIIKPFDEIKYKVYGYTLPEVPNHEGYVKIGDTTREVAARIFEQVGTAGLNPDILFERIAQKSDGEWFRDKDLHRFLLLNGITKRNFNQRADEWFYFNDNLKKAEELTEKYINLDYDESQIDDEHSSYTLRNEQQQAVEKTYEYYNSGQEPKGFLWNAKPRFGKTLTTYDFIRNLKATNVLIVTNRPAIANSWYDDFHKFIAWQEPQMKFISETDVLKEKAFTREDWLEYINTTEYPNPSQITFISLQDLKGAKFAGGNYKKLEWVPDVDWDLLVIDEAHEGVDTQKTDLAFSQLNRKFTLHLSGTPFKALADDKFSEEQIFNWSYVDEQNAKENWDQSIGSNPYESLPTLNMFSYQMSKMVEDEVSKGISIDEEENVDYAFDLNEFFKVKDSGKFEYKESVKRFLDNLTSRKFPFAKRQYRNELNHTFWLLPRVNAAKALERLLNNHPTFKDYKVILAAGDGVSVDSVEDEAMDVRKNTKSFTKVREAIKTHEKTITLSVGQLTTGVTIPEWTAVLMLNNIQSPSLYFQAAFRSQNPYEFEKDGKLYRKENAYIFDFSPDRTLDLYGDFATNLTGTSSKTTGERKEKIKRLLNFFPVIAEDEEGAMHELDASEVLQIPTRITSQEVVKRGFMSNLLFANISGIFSGNSSFKEILDKIPPEKNKRLGERREIPVTDPHLNDEGGVEVPPDITIGKSKELFGEKIFETIDFEEIPTTFSSDQAKEEKEKTIKNLAKDITKSLDSGFENYKKSFELSKGKTEEVEKSVNEALEDVIREKSLTFDNQMNSINKEYEDELRKVEQSNDEQRMKDIEQQYEEKKDHAKQSFVGEIHKEAEKTIHNAVAEQVIKGEEKKKKITEDYVRDRLRGFARTIPAFLMAYSDENTTLANFEENIDESTFKDLTSITIEEFKKLRDGFEYVDDGGEKKSVQGLFNEVVFNSSIREFLDTKERLSNYFDESLEEDIFDYIPPQKTNQIFTPKNVAKKMVDILEEENPGIFSDKSKKFVDLYVKSGLYITEIVKKLNIGLTDQITNQQERIKWILENQVYACAPSNIIYNIVKNFIFGSTSNVSCKNLLELDTMKLTSEGKLSAEIYGAFGDDNLNFDVIIGNPPYQDETIGDNKTYAPPIYHKFLEEAYNLSNKVVMIHPSRFLFNAGSTPKAWNKKMLSDKHLKVVNYFNDSSKVFPNTDIKGGIAITYRDDEKVFGKIGTFTAYDELNLILNKVGSNTSKTLDSFISGRGVYKLAKAAHEDYPEIEDIQSKGHKNDIGSGAFELLKDIIFYKDKPKCDGELISILGLENSQRTYYWMAKKYLNAPSSFQEYKVIIPKASGSGTFGEVISSPLILEPNVGATETFLSIGGFSTKYEAESVLKYIKSKFTRAMLGVLKITQDNTRDKWSKVPFQDFTEKSDIDWLKSISEIDQQLYEKYDLSQDEIEFIENNVKPME